MHMIWFVILSRIRTFCKILFCKELFSRIYIYSFTFCIFLVNLWWTVTHATWVQHTTIRLQLVAQFTWAIENTSTQVIFQDNIYRTSWLNHTIELISTIWATYELDGDIQYMVTWTLIWSLPQSRDVLLTSWDGLKQISWLYISEEFIQLPITITYGVDTTPPPLTTSFSWPTTSLEENQPISFSRNAVTDTGVGLHTYIIQLSQSPLFSTAIQFTSTWTSLTLWWWSITPWVRYRRRWAADYLWNVIYWIPLSFSVATPASNYWTNSSISDSSVPKEQIENSVTWDQCPGWDNSGNYFDGICSWVSDAPILLNVPDAHQAADTLPRREKIYNQFTEPRVTLYVFPNYEAPKPYTIYEHTPTYVYNDIYEYQENKKSAYPQLPYQPTFWTKKIADTKSFLFTSKFDGIPTSRATTYLFYRFVQTHQSCADIGQRCPANPICRDISSSCYEQFVCLDHEWYNAIIARCPRKS